MDGELFMDIKRKKEELDQRRSFVKNQKAALRKKLNAMGPNEDE